MSPIQHTANALRYATIYALITSKGGILQHHLQKVKTHTTHKNALKQLTQCSLYYCTIPKLMYHFF
jgi:hypothetical protein